MAWVESHHGGVLTSQLQLQQDEAFSDLTLRLRDGEVRACRCTVASLSRVFYRMLATDMRERNGGLLTLELVSREDWHCILAFYMSGNKLVTPDNVEGLLTIAHLYELDALVEDCGRVLVDSLTSENCCDRLAMSKMYVPSVTTTIVDYIKENFDAASQTDAFLTLTKEDMLKLLDSPGVITTEDSLCDILLKWLERRGTDEETNTEILGRLNLEELSCENLCTKLMYHSLVVTNACLRQTIVDEVMRRSRNNDVSENNISQYRFPKGTAKDFIVVGHTNKGLHTRTFILRKHDNAWEELPSVNISPSSALHMVGDTVYVTGGETSATTSTSKKSTHMFHTQSHAWSAGPDLVEARFDHRMTSVNKSLFAVAGWDEDVLSSIEKHDIGSDRWDKIGDLHIATDLHGVAAVGDVIIVAGGRVSPDAIQTFNVETRAAAVLGTRLPRPMNSARGVSLAGRAVFLGDGGDLVHLSPSSNSFSMTSHAQLPNFGKRGLFGLIVQGQRLICFGGGRTRKGGRRVDCYTLQGEHVNTCSLPRLPVALNVDDAFLAHVSSF